MEFDWEVFTVTEKGGGWKAGRPESISLVRVKVSFSTTMARMRQSITTMAFLEEIVIGDRREVRSVPGSADEPDGFSDNFECHRRKLVAGSLAAGGGAS